MSAPLRVVVVDDEPLARTGVADLVRRDPELTVVAECADGAAAVEAIERLHPDLVLLDVQLPDANGFDILAKMRQHPVLRLMPVIMLTAEATREAVLKGLQGGADGYVTKPFEPDMLISAVKAVLGLSAPAGKKK